MDADFRAFTIAKKKKAIVNTTNYGICCPTLTLIDHLETSFLLTT